MATMRLHSRWRLASLIVGAIGTALASGPRAWAESPPLSSERIDALIESAGGELEVLNTDGTWSASEDTHLLHDAILRNELSEAQWDRLLERSNILPSHSTWLANTPVVLRPMAPGWVGEGGSVRIAAVGYANRGEASARALQGWSNLSRRDRIGFATSITLDALALGPHEIRCHVTVDVWSADRKVQVTHDGAINRIIEVVESGALTPVSTPELDRAVRDSIEIRLFANPDNHAFLVSYPNDDTTALEQFDHIGFGAIVEVLDDGGNVVTAKRVPLSSHQEGTYVYTLTHTSPPLRGPIPLGDASKGWTVRVRGDEAEALRSGDCDSYWSGEFTIPLAEVRRGPDSPGAPEFESK